MFGWVLRGQHNSYIISGDIYNKRPRSTEAQGNSMSESDYLRRVEAELEQRLQDPAIDRLLEYGSDMYETYNTKVSAHKTNEVVEVAREYMQDNELIGAEVLVTGRIRHYEAYDDTDQAWDKFVARHNLNPGGDGSGDYAEVSNLPLRLGDVIPLGPVRGEDSPPVLGLHPMHAHITKQDIAEQEQSGDYCPYIAMRFDEIEEIELVHPSPEYVCQDLEQRDYLSITGICDQLEAATNDEAKIAILRDVQFRLPRVLSEPYTYKQAAQGLEELLDSSFRPDEAAQRLWLQGEITMRLGEQDDARKYTVAQPVEVTATIQGVLLEEEQLAADQIELRPLVELAVLTPEPYAGTMMVAVAPRTITKVESLRGPTHLARLLGNTALGQYPGVEQPSQAIDDTEAAVPTTAALARQQDTPLVDGPSTPPDTPPVLADRTASPERQQAMRQFARETYRQMMQLGGQRFATKEAAQAAHAEFSERFNRLRELSYTDSSLLEVHIGHARYQQFNPILQQPSQREQTAGYSVQLEDGGTVAFGSAAGVVRTVYGSYRHNQQTDQWHYQVQLSIDALGSNPVAFTTRAGTISAQVYQLVHASPDAQISLLDDYRHSRMVAAAEQLQALGSAESFIMPLQHFYEALAADQSSLAVDVAPGLVTDILAQAYGQYDDQAQREQVMSFLHELLTDRFASLAAPQQLERVVMRIESVAPHNGQIVLIGTGLTDTTGEQVLQVPLGALAGSKLSQYIA